MMCVWYLPASIFLPHVLASIVVSLCNIPAEPGVGRYNVLLASDRMVPNAHVTNCEIARVGVGVDTEIDRTTNQRMVGNLFHVFFTQRAVMSATVRLFPFMVDSMVEIFVGNSFGEICGLGSFLESLRIKLVDLADLCPMSIRMMVDQRWQKPFWVGLELIFANWLKNRVVMAVVDFMLVLHLT